MDRLWSEHEVHERRAFEDALTFLARDASADADDEIRFLELQEPPLAEMGEDFLLRLLAHRAGVQQDHVRLFGVSRELEAPGYAEHVRHPRRVVFVHLAAEGRNVE